MTNGTADSKKFKYIDSTWEIVYDGGAGFIGRVTCELANGMLEMTPVFHYHSQPNIKPGHSGTQFGPNTRIAFPVEMLGSTGAVLIRATRRYPIGVMDEHDQHLYDDLVEKASTVRLEFAAMRSNLVIQSEMPSVPIPRAAR